MFPQRIQASLFYVLAAIIAMVGFNQNAMAKTGTYRVALLHVTYSNATPTYTVAQLKQAAGEIHDYYDKLSNGLLNMEVLPVEVKLNHTREFYFAQCQPAPQETRNPCPPPLIEDAAEVAASGGFSFTGVDGISVLSPFCTTDWSFAGVFISRPGVSGTFQRSLDYECPGPAPGSSGVLWGAWAHEYGHQLEYVDYGHMIHPSGYSSGYDIMDSCYPCGGSAYTLLDAPIVSGDKKIFGGWLKATNVAVVDAASPGTTVTLTPIGESIASVQANQAIQVPIVPGKYYMVEARRRVGPDALQNHGQPPQGIYDEGVHIAEIEETRDPPMKIMNACDTTVPGGCIYNADTDPRTATCNATSRPAYCWPYALWHVGEMFKDSANGIEINVTSAVGNGFAVKITRGASSGHPNLFIVPWLTPPMNTYETVDLWVDSSCNGYESDVGPSGLRYGRRDDGTVIGNGDDPCANHENRIYTRVRNNGDAPANNVVVGFEVSDPLGVGVTGSWNPVAETLPITLAPGEAKEVSALWTPVVTLTPGQIASGHFKYHSCIKATAKTTAGELIGSDNDAQENFGNFEAVQYQNKSYSRIYQPFFIHNSERRPQTYFLNVKSDLPKDWKYNVAQGRQSITLGIADTMQVPVSVDVPKGTAVGQAFKLDVQALTRATLKNNAIPSSWPVRREHYEMARAGGVTLEARTVLPSNLSLNIVADPKGVKATGTLNPPIQTTVAVDFGYRGALYTRLAKTDEKGRFTCVLSSARGIYRVRTLWQGDGIHTGAVSPIRTLVTGPGPDVFIPPPKLAACE